VKLLFTRVAIFQNGPTGRRFADRVLMRIVKLLVHGRCEAPERDAARAAVAHLPRAWRGVDDAATVHRRGEVRDPEWRT